jgi:hypothetical protein
MRGPTPMIMEGMYIGARIIGRANRFSAEANPSQMFFSVQTDQGGQYFRLKSSYSAEVGDLLLSGCKYPDNPKIHPSNTKGFK